MIFSNDTELTLRAACVLVNSDRADGERLADLGALDAYLDSFGWTGRRDGDAAELRSVHRLRKRLGELWALAGDEEQVVEAVNALLSDTKASPWLTRHPEMPEWHLHLASREDPLWQRMGAEMAMALANTPTTALVWPRPFCDEDDRGQYAERHGAAGLGAPYPLCYYVRVSQS